MIQLAIKLLLLRCNDDSFDDMRCVAEIGGMVSLLRFGSKIGGSWDVETKC